MQLLQRQELLQQNTLQVAAMGPLTQANPRIPLKNMCILMSSLAGQTPMTTPHAVASALGSLAAKSHQAAAMEPLTQANPCIRLKYMSILTPVQAKQS